ncbi:hypothetical protein ACFL56_03820, partial [Candidatus Margulisiibacteriota bacterium]
MTDNCTNCNEIGPNPFTRERQQNVEDAPDRTGGSTPNPAEYRQFSFVDYDNGYFAIKLTVDQIRNDGSYEVLRSTGIENNRQTTNVLGIMIYAYIRGYYLSGETADIDNDGTNDEYNTRRIFNNGSVYDRVQAIRNNANLTRVQQYNQLCTLITDEIESNSTFRQIVDDQEYYLSLSYENTIINDLGRRYRGDLCENDILYIVFDSEGNTVPGIISAENAEGISPDEIDDTIFETAIGDDDFETELPDIDLSELERRIREFMGYIESSFKYDSVRQRTILRHQDRIDTIIDELDRAISLYRININLLNPELESEYGQIVEQTDTAFTNDSNGYEYVNTLWNAYVPLKEVYDRLVRTIRDPL